MIQDIIIRVSNKVNIGYSQKNYMDKYLTSTMEKGYKEMATINLSLSKLYFGVENEVDTCYEDIVESE
ncbi:MAG: hypothetical protein ACRCSG_05680 [Cellulosilyticaceae bacterium]